MSILSKFEPTPNRMEILYRTLLSVGDQGIPERSLRVLLSPSRLGESVIVENVIGEGLAMGIAEKMPGDILRIGKGLYSTGTDFREWCEVCLLDPIIAKKRGQEFFPLALAWFLERNPYDPMRLDTNVKSLISDELGISAEDVDLTNKDRFRMFAYWAKYLGYARTLQLAGPGGSLVFPDPTRALARLIPRLLKSGERVTLGELKSRWAESAPVLEGGRVRQDVLKRLRTRRHPLDLSQSTSFALRNLEDRGLVRLERLADANAFNLTDPEGAEPKSHLTWI
jgi:hypothetical protein